MGCGLARPVEGRRGQRRGTSTEQTQRQATTAVQTTHREPTSVGGSQNTHNGSTAAHTASLATAREDANPQGAHITPTRPLHPAQTHPAAAIREASSQANSDTSARAPAPVQLSPSILRTAARPQAIPTASAAASLNQARPAIADRETAMPDRGELSSSLREQTAIRPAGVPSTRPQPADEGILEGLSSISLPGHGRGRVTETNLIPPPTQATRPSDGLGSNTSSSTGAGSSTGAVPPKHAGSSTGAGTSRSQPPSEGFPLRQPEARHPSKARGTATRSDVAPSSIPKSRPPAPRGRAAPEFSTSPGMKIWFLTAFLLSAKNTQHHKATLKNFVETLATKYNEKLPPPRADMNPNLLADVDADAKCRPSQWCLVQVLDDETCIPFDSANPPPGESPCKSLHFEPRRRNTATAQTDNALGEVKLVSPVFSVFPGSPWRQTVKELWRYLSNHCHIDGNVYHGTHVHVFRTPDANAREGQRLAFAILQFETAIEALVPDRVGHPDARSNWLHSEFLARQARSRRDAINFVEQQYWQCGLPTTMQSPDSSDQKFCWNFRSWEQRGPNVIEFRKPPPSTSLLQALVWAEFTLCFVQASMRCAVRDLVDIPANVGGLCWFLCRYTVHWLHNECESLNAIWNGIPSNAMLEPRPSFPPSYPQADILSELELLNRMIREDKRWLEGLERS